MNIEYKHIESVRSDFRATQRIKNSLNNSIRALARDLYQKDAHFVFELIQNAEDNDYDIVEPSLAFRLAKKDPTGTTANGALIVQNNESGFARENIDAICTVGDSTKTKAQGYIGEKGIGFKSVFRVTSLPHIFSNGYRICLPEQDEETGLGYIVPRWVDDTPDGVESSFTNIILPLDKPNFGYEVIETMLREIEPVTILFLSKLRKLKIETDTGYEVTIRKDDSEYPLVRVMVSGRDQNDLIEYCDEFLLHTQSVDRPAHVRHEKREDILTRDISIACPLNEDNKSAGKIFAYLPVRADTGLPFLVNADFLLTSSRKTFTKMSCGTSG